MINTKYYDYLDNTGYTSKDEAYEVLNTLYIGYKGATVFRDPADGLWYIVQSKVIREM